MDASRLDEQIAELERSIPDKPSLIFKTRERPDWRPLFALAREIQAGFNSGVRYPTREARQSAWERFNAARSKLHASSKAHQKDFEQTSTFHRDHLLHLLNKAEPPGSAEAFIGLITGVALIDAFSDEAETMKQRGSYLREAKRDFSERKREMTRDHKTEVYERIGEVQDEHDRWWGVYKREKAEQRKKSAAEYQERQERRYQRLAKAEANLEANTERYEKASRALAAVRRNIAENEERLASARSDSFRERVAGWIEEGRDKERDIEAQMDRISGWMQEDRERIRDLRARLNK